MKLECPQCMKKVDELVEVIIEETDGTHVKIIRCDDCWEVARSMMPAVTNN